MSFFVYILVLLVAAGSVVFGLDWMQSPIAVMPSGGPAMSVASAPALAAKPKPVATKPKPAAATPTAEDAAQLDAKLSPIYPARPTVPPAAAAALASAPAAPARPPRQCDVEACARAYYTFRPFDCTYQPSRGERQLCTKGNPPKAAADASAAATQARAQASCNVEACGRAYQSFTASDCTYQPYGGPRRLCTK
ncbi:MAG TPA: BA14K family protein [Pseudolabrys sp.]|nr:BA14K family protein [Pseudolabrys sp.]